MPEKSKSPVLAAGGVLWREEQKRSSGTSIEVALVHRPKYDDWSFPKGKLESGESLAAAAVREIAEETGIQACLGPQLGAAQYQVEGREKLVTYWLAQVLQTPAILARGYVRPAAKKEIDELRWVPLADVEEILTYEFDRELAGLAKEKLLAGWGQSRCLVLLRHAKAKNRLKWDTDDSLRPLKKRGKRQAQVLVGILSAFGVSQVWTSPWVRCVQTVKPYLKACGIQAVFSDLLSEDGYAKYPLEGVELLKTQSERALENGSAVLCTHGPLLQQWQQHLGREFLKQTLMPLEVGEALVVHLMKTQSTAVSGGVKIIAVERHLCSCRQNT